MTRANTYFAGCIHIIRSWDDGLYDTAYVSAAGPERVLISWDLVKPEPDETVSPAVANVLGHAAVAIGRLAFAWVDAPLPNMVVHDRPDEKNPFALIKRRFIGGKRTMVSTDDADSASLFFSDGYHGHDVAVGYIGAESTAPDLDTLSCRPETIRLDSTVSALFAPGVDGDMFVIVANSSHVMATIMVEFRRSAAMAGIMIEDKP